MKKILMTMAMAATCMTMTLAQTHRASVRTEVSIDGIETTGTIETTDRKDSLTVYNHFLSRTNGTWNFNFLSISNESKTNDKGRSCTTSQLVGIDNFYVGLTGLKDVKGFEFQQSRSMELGFDILTLKHYPRSQRFALLASLGLSWSRYMTQHNQVFQLSDNGDLYCGEWLDAKKSFSRARLTYVSWRMPIMLQWASSNNNFKFAAGAELENRHHVRSRVKYGNTKRYDVLRHDMDVNPWGCNALVRLSFHDISLYGRYSLTPLFGTNHTALEGTPFSVGLSFDI